MNIYFDTRLEYEYEMMNELVENEMQRTRVQALKKLSILGAHFNKKIANILAYSYFDSLPDAKTIADELGLGKLDFLAIQENFDRFKEEYLANQQEGYEYAI